MQDDKPKIKEEILTRVRWLYILFFVVGLTFTCRLAYVIYGSTEVADNAERMRRRIVQRWDVPALRGSILSRDGEPMATSIFRYQVEMEFWSPGFDSLAVFARNADSLSKLLAAYFGDRTPQQYYDFMIAQHNKHYRTYNLRDTSVYRSESTVGRFFDRVFNREFRTYKIADTMRDSTPVKLLPREVDFREWQQLSKYPILNHNMGITYRLDKRDSRVYPMGELARRTIGANDTVSGARYGIEYVWRSELAGHTGTAQRQRIAPGFYSRVAGGNDTVPENGADIVTTFDLELQQAAEKALRTQLEKENAIWGTTIVMETATGDILAMVNLSRTKQGTYAENLNHALAGRMEPGSTFKLAALLALVENGGKDLSLSYDSGNGRAVTVGRAVVQDSHSGFSMTDLKTATAQSLNVFYAKAIYDEYKHDPKRYTDFLSSLHLDRCMGLEDFGERPPVFPTPGSKIWYPDVTLPNMGYGYGIELCPIQTLTLYNAVANNGRMVAPRLVREVRRNGERPEKLKPRTLVEHICSDRSLAKVRECLEEVALTGTAKGSLGGEGRPYRVGAKTGTAKFAQGGIHYSDGYRLGSMVAYMPAEKPKYTFMTAIFTRHGYGTTVYGAGLAGPVQREVADYLYARECELGSSTPADRSTESETARRPRTIKNGDIGQMRRVARSLSGKTSSEQRQGWGRITVDSASNATITPLHTERGQVPDVGGMGLKEAMFLLENAGLKVTFRGRGAVVSQSLAAGTACRPGDKIEIVLK